MNFKEFNERIQKQAKRMFDTGKVFRSSVSGHDIWDAYINGFLPENNVKFRDPESSEHECNCCNNFLRRYGNIIAVIGDKRESLFDNLGDVEEYNEPVEAILSLLSNGVIQDVFFETHAELNSLNYEKCSKTNSHYQLGIKNNFKKYTQAECDLYGIVNPDEVYEFVHFNIKLPTVFVDKSGVSVESIMGKYRSKFDVFNRAMIEIPLDTIELVEDLLAQGSFLNGASYIHSIQFLKETKKLYNSASNKTDWCWTYSYDLAEEKAKIRNHQIGKTLTDLSEGKDINIVWKEWNRMEDPTNKHKPKAPITEKQKRAAQEYVESNGYADSFRRRFATLSDIKASEILHLNEGDGSLPSVSIFDSVKPAVSTRHKRSEFSKVEEISIEKFMKDVLPKCTSVEAYLDNKHINNLAVLTTSLVPDSKPIFKWNNNYSWTFGNNLAGKSFIKDSIKSRGGDTEGVLNIRLAFPDTTSDYDLHVQEPNGNTIYYRTLRSRLPSSGMLDLDAQGLDGHQIPEKRVENINYNQLAAMSQGVYTVYVNDFSGSKFPARAYIEVEFDGETHEFIIEKGPRSNKCDVCKITLKNGQFTIEAAPNIIEGESALTSKEIYGLNTLEFHKVNLICKSPNHWGENNVGNLHYFFMLDKCSVPVNLRGFHNENLNSDLYEHRRVLEALGNAVFAEPVPKHLAGLGFNATVPDELVVKCSGSFKRMLKIKF